MTEKLIVCGSQNTRESQKIKNTFSRLITKKQGLLNDQENLTLILILKDYYELLEMAKFSRFT